MAPMVATTPVTSPVADVPPPVPVNAARQPIADATPTLAAPRGGAGAITRRSLRKPS